jgi:hypothetical protein
MTNEEKIQLITEKLLKDDINGKKHYGKNRIREEISKSMGRGWQRSNLIVFENILKHLYNTTNDLTLAHKILNEELTIIQAKRLVFVDEEIINHSNETASYLYMVACFSYDEDVIGPVDGLRKIGRSIDYNGRIYKLNRELNRGSKKHKNSETIKPHEYKIVKLYKGTKNDIRSLENELHKELKDARIKGEWFKFKNSTMYKLYDVIDSYDVVEIKEGF